MNQNQTTLHQISSQELQEIYQYLPTMMKIKLKALYPAAFATQAARGCPLVEYDRHDDVLPQVLKGGAR